MNNPDVQVGDEITVTYQGAVTNFDHGKVTISHAHAPIDSLTLPVANLLHLPVKVQVVKRAKPKYKPATGDTIGGKQFTEHMWKRGSIFSIEFVTQNNGSATRVAVLQADGRLLDINDGRRFTFNAILDRDKINIKYIPE